MHEMALTRSVLDIVLEEAERHGAAEVRSVRLTIGSLRDIVEGMFDGLFAHLARGTVAEHAELVIVRTPAAVRCNACGYVFHPDVRRAGCSVPAPACPACGRRDFGLVSGMEFRVDRIDMAGHAAEGAA